MMTNEKFTRNYCKSHGIRYRLKAMGLDYQLYLFNPILRKYQYCIFCISALSENQIRVAIEEHVATYGK